MVAPTDLAVAVLIVGISLAGAFDLVSREVPDNLWRVLGLIGAAIGVLVITEPGSVLPVVLWVVVAAYGLQHFFSWTEPLAARPPRLDLVAEGVLTVAAVLTVAIPAALVGIGPTTVPYAVLATLATTLVARGLYESRLLTGGADAKALIAMGIVLPLFPTSLLNFGPTSTSFLQVVPFAFNALVDAALLSLLVPLALALRNLRAGRFRWRDGFTTYDLPIDQIPQRFVWVEEPGVAASERDRQEETPEEELARRRAQVALLRSQGRLTARVSPQLPFVFFLALGSVLAVVAGDLLWDLVATL